MKTPNGIAQVPKLEALVRRLLGQALEGDLAAARLLFQAMPPPQQTPGGNGDDDPINASNLDDDALKRMLARFDVFLSPGQRK